MFTSRPPAPAPGHAAVGGDAEDRVDDDVDAAADASCEPGGERVDVAGERNHLVGTGAPRPAPAAASDRQTATTRAAPSSLPRPTAAWPTAPPGAEHEHALPRRSCARAVSAIHAATPDMPRPRPARSGTPSGSGTTSSSADRAALGEAAVARRHAGRRSRRRPACPAGSTAGPFDDAHALGAGDVRAWPAGRSTTCPTRRAGPAARSARRSSARERARRVGRVGVLPVRGRLARGCPGRPRARRPPVTAAGST